MPFNRQINATCLPFLQCSLFHRFFSSFPTINRLFLCPLESLFRISYLQVTAYCPCKAIESRTDLTFYTGLVQASSNQRASLSHTLDRDASLSPLLLAVASRVSGEVKRFERIETQSLTFCSIATSICCNQQSHCPTCYEEAGEGTRCTNPCHNHMLSVSFVFFLLPLKQGSSF